MTVQIGKAKYNVSEKRNIFKIKDGNNVFRILPPIGTMADKNKWAVYAKIHWGLKTSDNKYMNFLCVEKKDNKTKMVTERCALCDEIADMKATRDAKAKALADKGASREEIAVRTKTEEDWLRKYNLDTKWHVNVINREGEVGLLKFAHSYYKDLELLINNLVDPPKDPVTGKQVRKPIDPIDPAEGVLFDFFYREGNQKTRVQKVNLIKETKDVGGESVEVIKKVPLSEAMLTKFMAGFYDLGNLARKLTPEEIKTIVSSKFSLEVIDSVYSSGRVTQAKEPVKVVEEPEEEEPTETEATLPKVAKQPEVTTAPVKQEQKAQTPAPSSTSAASAEDFFAQFSQQ